MRLRALSRAAFLAGLFVAAAATHETAGAVEILFQAQVPRLDQLSVTIPTSGGDVLAQLDVKFDEKGRLIQRGPCTVDGVPVSVKGTLRLRRGVPSFKIKSSSAKGAAESVSVTLSGDLNSSVVSCQYKGPKGKVSKLERPVTMQLERNLLVTMEIFLSVDCKGKISGEGRFISGFGNDVAGLGSLKGKFNQQKGKLKLSLKNGKQKFSFSGQLKGNNLSGTATINLPPEKNRISLQLDPQLFVNLEDCGGARNHPPVALAGPDQRVNVGDTVFLDGSASTDPDDAPLTYSWEFASRPAGSSAAFLDAVSPFTSFFVDVPGVYEVELTVSDGINDSLPDAISVATNSPPIADAGPDQDVLVGTTVQLVGTASSDADQEILQYQWFFSGFPSGSSPVLSDPSSPTPTFVVDLPGTYELSLTVLDETFLSDDDTVVITARDVRPPGWEEPTEVATGFRVGAPHVAVDSSGGAVVAWASFGDLGERHPVVASRYEPGPGWGPAVPLEAEPEGYADHVRVASDAAGNAVAVWYRRGKEGGREDHIWASRYDASSGWQPASIIDTLPPDTAVGVSTDTWVAMSSDGFAFAVWIQSDSRDVATLGRIYWNIMVRRHAPGGGWESPEIANAGTGRWGVGYPRVAADASGNALVVWSQHDASSAALSTVYANRYVADGSAWSGAQVLFSSGARNAAWDTRLVMNPGGHAFAAWTFEDNGDSEQRFKGRCKRFDPAAGWESGAESLDFLQPVNYQVAIDPQRNVYALWSEMNPQDFRTEIRVKRYDAMVDGWGPVDTISVESLSADLPQLGVDATGNATVVWQHSQIRSTRIQTRRHVPGTGWSAPGFLDVVPARGTNGQPFVAVGASGVAVAVWMHDGGTLGTIWANRFTP